MSQTADPSIAPLFTRVNVGRTSYAIVEQIKKYIQDGTLTSGDQLPNERDLCQQFGVSRVTVREALRILEANGLIEVRVGAHGGSFLTSPSKELVGENLAHLLSLSDISGAAAIEARQVVELAILPLAIEHATEEDIDALRALVDESSELEEYSADMSAEFHVRLAASTHNAAIEALMNSFYGPILASLSVAKASAPAMGKVGIEEHRQIVEAIATRDVDRARRIMTTHLERTARRVADRT